MVLTYENQLFICLEYFFKYFVLKGSVSVKLNGINTYVKTESNLFMDLYFHPTSDLSLRKKTKQKDR